ncbi:Glutaredoxin Domain-Containing Cysteine-Rich Protein 1 [Manis pentadactyla]|nr:Glutaredoxin Domain-Containing Cysteine-Rich Protein 1 [Manis pentadactyla]
MEPSRDAVCHLVCDCLTSAHVASQRCRRLDQAPYKSPYLAGLCHLRPVLVLSKIGLLQLIFKKVPQSPKDVLSRAAVPAAMCASSVSSKDPRAVPDEG